MLSLFEDDGNLVALEWGKTADKQPSPLLEEARRQLNAYFDGTLQDFGLPLAPEGASFQRAVWDRLRRISFGVARPTQTSPRPLTMPPGPAAAPVGAAVAVVVGRPHAARLDQVGAACDQLKTS